MNYRKSVSTNVETAGGKPNGNGGGGRDGPAEYFSGKVDRPAGRMRLRLRKRRLLSMLIHFIIWTLIVLFIVAPAILHFSSTVQRNLVFLSFVRWPLIIDLTKPAEHGLPATRNLYLPSSDDVTLGVWHILPKSLIGIPSNSQSSVYDESLSKGLPVILYVHGNSGTRGGSHRVELYQVLRNLDYHVVAFDYRGYADSSNIAPTEDGVVHDATVMYKWLRDRVGASPLIIWGHSLGTGVATKMVKFLCDQGDPPAGLVLESPFNNLRDEIRHHPFASIYRRLPFFEEIFLDPMENNNIVFASDSSISGVTVPIIILHAEDDKVVPFHLGEKLFEAALSKRPKNCPSVKFYPFSPDRYYGHRYICRAPELPDIVRNFVNSCIVQKN